MSKRLEQTKQCDTCPWRVKTDPHQIPNGYSVDKHRKLASTIAEPGSVASLDNESYRAMACHYSEPKEERFCVGWLHHQLGRGNNIELRLAMMDYDNASKIEVIGQQHVRFEDTLPREAWGAPHGSSNI